MSKIKRSFWVDKEDWDEFAAYYSRSSEGASGALRVFIRAHLRKLREEGKLRQTVLVDLIGQDTPNKEEDK